MLFQYPSKRTGGGGIYKLSKFFTHKLIIHTLPLLIRQPRAREQRVAEL